MYFHHYSNPSLKKMSEEFSGASNIQVVCRFRPLNQLEKQMGGGEVVDFDGKTCKINVNISHVVF